MEASVTNAFAASALPPIDAGDPARTGVDQAGRAGRRWERIVGIALAAFVLLIFVVSTPARHNFYEHFTWQAAAWLEGQEGIRYPVCPSSGEPTFAGTPCSWVADENQPYNDFYLDVLPVLDAEGLPSGRALIPFPPLPAVVLTPFVAAFGLATDAQTLAAIIGGLDVWLAWWLLGALGLRLRMRAAATLFFGLGTVFWYTSMLGTTWYFAHVVAVGMSIVAIGLALRADPRGVAQARVAMGAAARPQSWADGTGGATSDRTDDADWRGTDDAEWPGDSRWPGDTAWPDNPADHDFAVGSRSPVTWFRDGVAEQRMGLRHRPWTLVDRRQFLAGFALGLAATARLTVIFGFPFLTFVGGGTPMRRTLSAGLGAALPVLALLIYNFVTTGHIFHPAYEYLYQQEANGYPALGYNPAWSIEDLRYIPQNLGLMLTGTPDFLPACQPGDVRSLFSETCPILIPRTAGMSVLLTSPAYLLAIPALLRLGRSRLVAGAAVAVSAIAFVNVMHFSQGWVQFGYRFSNDFAPFALVLVALGMLRLGQIRGWVAVLVGASIVINAWGVAWGVILQW